MSEVNLWLRHVHTHMYFTHVNTHTYTHKLVNYYVSKIKEKKQGKIYTQEAFLFIA